MKRLLYIGNRLSSPSASLPIMESHIEMLEAHFKIYNASNKKNKVLRLLDMIVTWLKWQHKSAYVIISVYSTLNFYYAWIIALLCRVTHKPYIAYLHGGNLPSRLVRSPKMSKAIFAHAYANVAPSDYLKSAFIKQGFKAILIPNFIQIENYPFKLRTKLSPRLLWVRAFEKTYLPEMTIEVFAEIQKIYPNAELCMVGPDKDGSMETCKKLSVALGLESQIIFMGKLPKTQWIALAAAYDIFISTTHFDNTPVSVLEAMSLGLPIVSTNVGGVPYLLEQEKTGMLSPDNDIPAMVENIQKLLESPDLATQLSKNAREKAETFDWNIVEKQWLDLLHHTHESGH